MAWIVFLLSNIGELCVKKEKMPVVLVRWPANLHVSTAPFHYMFKARYKYIIIFVITSHGMYEFVLYAFLNFVEHSPVFSAVWIEFYPA